MAKQVSKLFELDESWSGESSGERELTDALFGSVNCSRTLKRTKVKEKKKKLRQKRDHFTAEPQQQLQEVEKSISLQPAARVARDCHSEPISRIAGRKRKRRLRLQGEDEDTRTSNDREGIEEAGRDPKQKMIKAHHSKGVCVKATHDMEEAGKHAEKEVQSDSKVTTADLPASKSSKLHSKMANKMESARFRWINEQLYSTTGEEAKKLFEKEPELFSTYHQGFATQVSKWPVNPLDNVIAYIKSLPHDMVIADFGCGVAKLAQSVPHTVHSFDLVACNRFVTACDMAHVPLSNASVDVCVFCLSLMGTNITDFVKEARRVLKQEGRLKICDIASRFTSVEKFTRDVESLGFKLLKTCTYSKMFVDMEFRIISKSNPPNLPNIQLKPCWYKKR